MKKRRIKRQVYYIFSGILLLILVIIGINKYLTYINSNSYKLKELGYDEEQVEIILNLEEKQINDILTREHDKYIVLFLKEKYFMYKNLDRYLKYREKNTDDSLSHIVSIVNVGADYEWYDVEIDKETDLSKGNLMLVNKFNHLTDEFNPGEINNISSIYAYDDNSTTEEVFKAFKNMWSAAKEEELTLIITSSYRTYEDQDSIWSRYAYSHSDEWADSYAARAGYSEHQTGLALDIVTYNSTMDNFEETDEFKWLQKNAYKYGFILRYPKDKEDITGYSYESWHYRYVGKEMAKKIYKENITFDEYYAYYIEK